MPCLHQLRQFDQINNQSIGASGWLSLFSSISDARFYHHPDWFLAIDQHLSLPPLTLTSVEKSAKPIALLGWHASSNKRRVATALHDHLSLGDILIHKSLDCAEQSTAIDCALSAQNNNAWDWRIRNVPARSPLIHAIQSQKEWHIRRSRSSAWFNLDDDPAPPAGKLRRNLKRLHNKLSEHGTVSMQWICSQDELPDAYTQFTQLEASGWKAQNQHSTAIAHNPALLAFYEQLLTPRYPGIKPVITLLWLDDRCIAAQYALQTATTLSLLKIAYDENYANFSPGSLLLQKVIGAATEHGLNTVSLVTSPTWAERWHPHSEDVWHVTRYANNAGGHTIRALDGLKQTARARLRPAP